ncbi:RNA polymerase sigma-54 factor RpoN [Labilithrix luteola]|uniref:RNA polymerase sigma-54 factor RpoN n=1 Tax=Labilithrix luteola TaxID=1391654 RepID=A0A0K1PVX4_9BACT|nr:sigma-70 family RNA polymerase sigma factor [Labilithrix luteola]AKU97269.1 RNA polymerase sigma-54 factor RpoN [Labilithrix luteola]
MESYQRYGPALLRKAERMLGSRADAQDLVQGLFVDLLGKDVPTDLPYYYRALTNRCLTFLRDERNRARLLAAETEVVSGPRRTTCDDRVIGMDVLLKLSRRLEAQSLEILLYRFFDDMTQDEIASLVGLSRKTVGKKLEEIQMAIRALTDVAEVSP